MDMESLKIFLDVKHLGSITAAAESHFMTQPALGKRIVQLEKELNAALLLRGKGLSRVQLTPAGEAFSDIAERMLILYEQARELGSNVDLYQLSAACIRSAHDNLMPRVLGRLKKSHPALCLTIEDHHTAEILQLLENRRIDIGITHSPSVSKSLISTLLYEEPYRVVFCKEHPSAVGGVHPSELRAEGGIFQTFEPAFEEWFNRHWQPYSVKVRVNSTATAESYFSDTDDWCIVPESAARGMERRGFVSYSLLDEPCPHPVYMILNPRFHREGVDWFCEAVAETLENRKLTERL